jgi:hypothetical protein
LFRARGGRYRSLGWTFAVFCLLLFALKAKNYYLAPIYPLLLAAGAVALEDGLEARLPTRGSSGLGRRRRGWSRPAGP